MSTVHLKAGDEVIELWGGPIFIDADNIDTEDQKDLDYWGRCLTHLWERDGDDGKFWRRKYVLVGVEVVALVVRNDRPEVKLPGGSWLRLDTTETDIIDQAFILGIYGDDADPEPEPPAVRLRDVPARAFSIMKRTRADADDLGLGLDDPMDPYGMG